MYTHNLLPTSRSAAHVKKARSIGKGHAVGSWLYKVALRMCQRLRAKARRLTALNNGGPACFRSESADSVAERREEAFLLATEIERLSETLRSAVMLCYLQGKTPGEAARELNCPANTISIRLRRAKEHLQRRLAQRGVVLSTSVAATLGVASTSANVTPVLACTLAGTAVEMASGLATAGLVSGSISLLMKGALVNMWWKPAKLACLTLIATTLVTVPAWQSSSHLNAQQPADPLHAQIQVNPQGGAVRRDDARWLARTQPGAIVQYDYLNYLRFPQHQADPAKDQTYPADDNLPEEVKKWIAAQKKQEEAIRQEAEKRIREQRAQLYKRLREIQDTYTRAGDLDRALAIRDQARRLEVSLVDAQPNPGSLTGFRGQKGKTFVFQVTGRTEGSLWGGDGIYTDDSDLATAAVHSGLLRAGQQGLVQVTILDGLPRYVGSTKNGIASQNYESFPGSYQLSRPSLPGGVTFNPIDPDSGGPTDLRSTINSGPQLLKGVNFAPNINPPDKRAKEIGNLPR